MVTDRDYWRRRLAERDAPPPMPDVFGEQIPPLPAEFGPLAVPTGTEEKPPSIPPNLMAPFGGGTGRVEGERKRVGPEGKRTPAPPSGFERFVNVLSPEGTFSRGLGKALTTPVSLEELQTQHPVFQALMGLPVGVPMGSIAGTAGRGVARQLGQGVARAIETGGVSAGIPKTAETVAARAAKRPDFLSLGGVDTELKRLDQAIVSAKRVKADTSALNQARSELAEYRENLFLGQLPDEAAQRLPGLRQELFEAQEQLKMMREPTGVPLAPKFGTAERGEWEAARRMKSEAGVPVRNKAQQIAVGTRKVRELQNELADIEKMAQASEVQQVGAGQVGMGIGERPAQGQLLGEFKGVPTEQVPLIDRERIAAQQARRAQIAQGQAEMPITKTAVSEALSPAAKAAQATEGVIPKAPVGAGTAVPESVEQIAKASRVAPTGAKAVAAEKVVTPPVSAAPPAKPPGKPPVTLGDVPPPYVEPPMMGKNVLGMKPIQAGLSKFEEIENIARRTVSKVGIRLVEDNPLVSGAFKERARLKSVADSQAGRLSTKHGAALGKVFTLDKQGRVTNLAGVDATLPGAPTIQDVAARLPRYWSSLSSEQQQAMLALRRDVTPYRSLLEEVGVEVPARADVVEGGFYLPRGRADLEGADLPLKVATGLGRGGKKGFERPAVFESQAVGIEAGFRYPPISDTLAAYARDAGNRATDAHIATFFKTAKDETGQLLGNTPKMRLMQQNPAVATKMQVLKDSLDRLKRLSASLTKRQLEVIDKWQLDPTFDDLDVLLDGLKTMRGGRGAGMTAPEMQTALTATRQVIRALAPEYKVALRRAQATPRLEGAVGLPGMQGWAFPDDIANAANRILKGEGPPTGLAAAPIAVANAFNNLYRGARATLDNSAIGIQGLLGAADNPVAYGKALGVNIRAWGPGGDAALGRFISNFDDVARRAGRLSSDDWARANLRIGGAQTEFQLGRGVSEKLTKLPLVRQANRAFGYLGDALRLHWADDMLADELRRGKSVQALWDAGDVQRIGEVANNMTGWAAGKAFGSIGDLLLFAPRFLQSRLNTVAQGVAGLRPGASIEQRAARRSLLKMMGYGAIITVAANEMLGNETDFRPFIRVRRGNDWQTTWNPNFMRIRFGGRDWSIFGTWDSLARAITVTAMGRPQEALRGLGSGIVSLAWDFIGNRSFEGKPVRDNPVQFGAWLLESMMPFATQELPATIGGGIEAARAGKPSKVAGAAVTVAGELLGAKSSPVTLKDKLGIQDTEFEDYFAIPSNPQTRKRLAVEAGTDPVTREAYRTTNPEVDAKLFITGETTSFQTGTAYDAAVRLMKEHGIAVADIRSLEVKEDESPVITERRNNLLRDVGGAPTKTTPSPASTPSLPTRFGDFFSSLFGRDMEPTEPVDRELEELLRRYGITPEPVGVAP